MSAYDEAIARGKALAAQAKRSGARQVVRMEKESGMSAYDSIVSKAKALVQKGEASTEAQAIATVAEQDQELYGRYREEVRKGWQLPQVVRKVEAPASTDAFAIIKSIAMDLVDRGEAPTLAQAIDSVARAQPELLQQHRTEYRQQQRGG